MSNNFLSPNGIFSHGYGFVPKMMMRDKRLTIEAKAIYSYLSSFAGAGMTSFPSVELILEELGISEKRFYKHRKLLIDLGYVSITQEKDGNKFAKNVYVINIDLSHGSFDCTQNESAQNARAQNASTQNKGANSNSFNNNSLNSNNSNSNGKNGGEKKPAKPTPTKFEPLAELIKLGANEQNAKDWLSNRKKKLTQSALDALIRETAKGGITIERAVRECSERGWESYRSHYNLGGHSPQQSNVMQMGGQRPASTGNKQVDLENRNRQVAEEYARKKGWV